MHQGTVHNGESHEAIFGKLKRNCSSNNRIEGDPGYPWTTMLPDIDGIWNLQ